MNCFKCFSFDAQVPLLSCGHYCCPSCYVALKTDKQNRCLICNKRLIRGRKHNRETNDCSLSKSIKN